MMHSAEKPSSYVVKVSLAGASARGGCFDTWNFDYGEMRTYSYAKTLRLTDLETGAAFTGAELQAAIEGGRTTKT